MILGFILGLIVGSWASWLAYNWLQPVDLSEQEESFFPIYKGKND